MHRSVPIVAALALYVAVRPGVEIEPDTLRLTTEKTIAVLPFRNLSAEEENEYFVRGIHDDILTQLSKTSTLDVIARTSVRL